MVRVLKSGRDEEALENAERPEVEILESEKRKKQDSNASVAAEAERSRALQAKATANQSDLDEAKRKLVKFLDGKRGTEAVDAIFEEADHNHSGSIDLEELEEFCGVLGIGNFLTRSRWAVGMMRHISKNFGAGDMVLGRAAISAYLDDIGLGTGRATV